MAKTVLVVDDSEIARLDIVKPLKNAGFDILEADRGTVALEIVKKTPVDLLVTDVHMPDMNGLELCEAIAKAEIPSRPAILVVSTETNRDLKTRARAAGVKGWIIKPTDPVALVEVCLSIVAAGKAS